MAKDTRTYTYRGGLKTLQKLGAPRRKPFVQVLEALPPVDTDFQRFKTLTVPKPRKEDLHYTNIWSKVASISQEFEGQPYLLMLNALTIAILRHDEPPEEAVTLFLRLWEEESDYLIENLNFRWLVSSVATFRDHGSTESQRRVGLALALFFDMMKLYETERLYSGRRPAEPHPLKDRKDHDIVLRLAPFSIINGDLDRNLLLYLWEDCETADPVIRPLALHLLHEFNADRRTVFRRYKETRARKTAADLERQAKTGAAKPEKPGGR